MPRSRIASRCVLLAAAVLANAGCGPAAEATDESGAELVTSEVSAPFVEYRWQAPNFAALESDPPVTGPEWYWPPVASFEARFARQVPDSWAPGVVIGRFSAWSGGSADVDVSGLPPDVWAVRRSDDGGSVLEDHRPPTICRGSSPRVSRFSVAAGNTDRPGRVELVASGHALDFRVEVATVRRRLAQEDWNDWVYARTLVESGLELAAANAATARNEAWSACTGGDESADSCDVDAHLEIERKAELATACYESGLVGCYWAGRLDVLDDWVSYIDDRDRPLPPPIARGTLSRGPVDLVRLLVGLLIDSAVVPDPVRAQACWSIDPSIAVALAVLDAGASAKVASELQRRALDPARDLWTRIWMVTVLTKILDLDPSLLGGQFPSEARTAARWATSLGCAAALLASGTLDDAHYHCVQVESDIWQRYHEATSADAILEARAARRELYSGWMRASTIGE